MINASMMHRFLKIPASCTIWFGWYLFGVALLISFIPADFRDVHLMCSLLTTAGWLITAGFVLGYWLARRQSSRPFNLFRLFRWMDTVEALFAPVRMVTATAAGRIVLGVLMGFILLTLLKRD
jgi:hypothetical protein